MHSGDEERGCGHSQVKFRNSMQVESVTGLCGATEVTFDYFDKFCHQLKYRN